jgi:hypothetical protein
MIKALKKLGKEGMLLNKIKDINNKRTANIILSGEQLEPIPLRSRMRKVCPFFPTPIQYSFVMPSQSNKTRSKNKRDSNKEGKSQTLPIFR